MRPLCTLYKIMRACDYLEIKSKKKVSFIIMWRKTAQALNTVKSGSNPSSDIYQLEDLDKSVLSLGHTNLHSGDDLR